jgi:hypothetical protein
MAVYDFFLSRNNGPTVNTYIGHAGRLFYDNAERVLRISNGVTPGGEIFNGYVSVLETEPTQPFQGQVWLNPDTFELNIYHNGDFIPTIDVATETKLGGVKLGPGVTTNSEGQIIIDSTGLDFSFGDFAAIVGVYGDSTEYALLSSIKLDEDIVLASNGTGDIKVVGGFEVYATNGTVTSSLEDAEPFFRILEDGQVRILVPLADTTEGGVEIIGSDLGTALELALPGVMLHLTGNADLPTRVYHDTLGNYGSYVFRRYNGSVITPTQVLANEDIARFNWTAATDAGMGNVSTAQIRVTALENQTTTAQGSKITLTVTPVGSAASARVDVATITVADGVSATKFTGPLTGNVTGNVSGSAGSVVNALTAGTYLTSGGTYNGSTARTFAVDATTTNTVSKVVARDANGDFAARHISAKIKHATRNAGSVNGGLTIDYNTDDWIVGNFTTAFTITHSNLSAGMSATAVLYNSSGFGEDIITIGVGTENTTIQTNTITVNDTNLIILKFYSFGTTTADLYCDISYTNVE